MIFTQLHLPRRHRRPLLFPPGLLALAWLLWLGCVALPQLPKQEYYTQVSLPQISESDLEHTPPVFQRWYSAKIEDNWYSNSIHFNGNLFEDYFTLKQVQLQFARMRNFPTTPDSMRVHFSPNASYQSLIQVIAKAQQGPRLVNWLHVTGTSTVLYAFPEGEPYSTSSEFVCSDTSPDWFELSWLDKVLVLIQVPSAVPLLDPEWRNTWLGLLGIVLISFWKINRRSAAHATH